MTDARRQLASAKAAARLSKAAQSAATLVRHVGWPGAVTEHRFAPPRRWRFDVAYPAIRVAAEIEGGVWTGGRHTRGAGFAGDVEKYGKAAALGWVVVRVLPAQVRSGEAAAMVREAAAAHGRILLPPA